MLLGRAKFKNRAILKFTIAAIIDISLFPRLYSISRYLDKRENHDDV